MKDSVELSSAAVGPVDGLLASGVGALPGESSFCVQVDALVQGSAGVDVSSASSEDLTRLMAVVHASHRVLDGLTDRVAQRALELQAAGDGHPVEHVLSAGGELSAAQARVLERRARFCAEFSVIGAAVGAGELRAENIDELVRATRVLDITSEREALAGMQEQIVSKAATLPPEVFAKSIRRVVDQIMADHGHARIEQQRRRAKLSVIQRASGETFINGRCDAETGTIIKNALNLETRELAKSRKQQGERPVPGEQLQMQALRDLVVKGRQKPGSTKPGVSVAVIADRDTVLSGPHGATVCETVGGIPIPPETLDRMLCDATIRRLDSMDGKPISITGSHRTASDSERAGLRLLYDSCPITGLAFDQTEIHHVIFYSEVQETHISNLIPLAPLWHHRVHDEHWVLTLSQERTIDLYLPNGTHYLTIPWEEPSQFTTE